MEASGKPVDFDRMSMISQASTAVNEVPKSDVQEMKSFAAPPAPVKEVLFAVMLLLGYKESEVDWRAIQNLLAKTGQNSLKERVRDLDLEKIPQENLAKAKAILSRYNKDMIAKVSKAVQALYVWADLVVNE